MKNVPHFLKFWNSFLWWFFLANESCDILIFLYFSTTQVFRAPGAMLTHLSQRGMVGKETQNQNIYKASMALTYYSYMYMINQLCQAGFCKLSIVSLNHLNQLDWMHNCLLDHPSHRKFCGELDLENDTYISIYIAQCNALHIEEIRLNIKINLQFIGVHDLSAWS